jgi:hypothetical protein
MTRVMSAGLMIWDAALVLLWFAALGLGMKLWVHWLRPVRSWYYSPALAPNLAVRAGVAVVTAVLVAAYGIPFMALALALGVFTGIVVLVMAPVTWIAYRDRLDRGGLGGSHRP